MKKNRQGFTLIEVMVATAVLLIMVVMIGTLFTQSSSAWDTGYARAEGGMIVRGVVGAISRDLNTLIDGRPFEGVWTSSDSVEVSDSSLSFISMKAGEDEDAREPHLIEYSAGSSVTRKETPLKRNGTRWAKGTSQTTKLHDNGTTSSSMMGNAYEAKFTFVPVRPPSMTASTAMDRSGFEQGTEFKKIAWKNVIGVKVRLELTRSGSFSSLEVKSLGPNGLDNSDGSSKKPDDIIIR